jgi:hypothetical protein
MPATGKCSLDLLGRNACHERTRCGWLTVGITPPLAHSQQTLTEAQKRLVQLYDASGEPDEADPWPKKWGAGKNKKSDPRP